MKKNTPKEVKKYSHLNLEEREEIAIGLEKGMKRYEIALLINRSPSTISREIKKNVIYKDIVRYRAHYALCVTRNAWRTIGKSLKKNVKGYRING